MSKAHPGNFFEDFVVGQVLHHATPKTVTVGDVALYGALFGARFAVQSSDAFAQSLGYDCAPVDDLLVFHIVFGKTVADISLNAVANLGYAQCRFLLPVFSGDTLSARSEVIGLKQNSNGKTGIVYVRSRGFNQSGDCVLEYVRWVMVIKKDHDAVAPETVIPQLADTIDPAQFSDLPENVALAAYDCALAGSSYTWGDYEVGERIDHVDGVTIENSDHMMAARLFQNTARVHFDQHKAEQGRFKQRLVYGGHIISLARSLSFNGLENAFKIVGINAGSHISPCFAGDTIYAWSEIVDKAEVASRNDVGLLRIRTFAFKNQSCGEFPGHLAAEVPLNMVLELDCWILIRRL